MTQRLLRRRCIIREYDLERVREQALSVSEGHSLYDRVEWSPLDRQSMEQEAVIRALRGSQGWERWMPTHYPIYALTALKDYLYDSRYIKWTVSYDSEGQMWVQSKTNTPRTRLGWAVFEKDLDLDHAP